MFHIHASCKSNKKHPTKKERGTLLRQRYLLLIHFILEQEIRYIMPSVFPDWICYRKFYERILAKVGVGIVRPCTIDAVYSTRSLPFNDIEC